MAAQSPFGGGPREPDQVVRVVLAVEQVGEDGGGEAGSSKLEREVVTALMEALEAGARSRTADEVTGGGCVSLVRLDRGTMRTPHRPARSG